MKKYFAKSVIKKTQVIRPAVSQPKLLISKNKSEKCTLLFIGSINNPNDFIMKGGIQAIQVFESLQKKHKNIQLIIRSKVPDTIKRAIQNKNQVILLDQDLPFSKIQELYQDADILLEPSHSYVLMASLEAMAFGLPIIALDSYATKNYIQNNKNGFVIKPSKKLKEQYNKENYPNNIRSKEFFNSILINDEELIYRLTKKTEILIKNKKLRERLGNNGKKIAQTKFSISTRNKAWKKLFNEII